MGTMMKKRTGKKMHPHLETIQQEDLTENYLEKNMIHSEQQNYQTQMLKH